MNRKFFPIGIDHKTMAEMEAICLVSNLIINNNHNSGTLNTRVNNSFGETTLSTIITSAGFGVMIYLAIHLDTV